MWVKDFFIQDHSDYLWHSATSMQHSFIYILIIPASPICPAAITLLHAFHAQISSSVLSYFSTHSWLSLALNLWRVQCQKYGGAGKQLIYTQICILCTKLFQMSQVWLLESIQAQWQKWVYFTMSASVFTWMFDFGKVCFIFSFNLQACQDGASWQVTPVKVKKP